jgi:hypothetical protein
MDGACSIGEVHTEFWWENLRKRNHLEHPGIDGRIILRCIFRKWDRAAWTGRIWLIRGTGDGLENSVIILRIP